MKRTTTKIRRSLVVFCLLSLILMTIGSYRVAGQNIFMSTTTYNITCPFPAGSYFYDQSIIPGTTGGSACGIASNGNYDDQAIFVETFQTTNGQCITVNFFLSSLAICAGDTLFLYDGPSTASPPLGNFYNVINFSSCGTGFLTNCSAGTPTSIASTSQQVTFKFKPNNDGQNAKGWKISFTCGTCPGAPSNDVCSNATQLSPGSTCSYTSGNTFNGTQTLAACTGTVTSDVWYRWVANNSTQTITVQPVGSWDPVVQVFSGSCGTPVSIICKNAGGAGVTETVILTGLTIGATYFYRVYDFTGAPFNTSNPFNTCVVGSSPTDCTGAAQVCSTASITGTLNSGPGFYDCSNGANCSCNSSGEFNSVWYKFQFLTGGTFQFKFVSNGTYQDIDWVLWNVASLTTCGSAMGAPVRCSYSVPSGSTQMGLPAYSTGLTTLENNFDVSEGGGGTAPIISYVYAVTVTAGQYYVLLANLFSGSSAYTLSWTLTNGASFNSCLLPVELTSFYGEKEDKMNLLKWTTAAEMNSDYFTLERSADGNQFTPVTTMDAAGFSTSPLDYEYLDEQPLNGINYYRLRQTDFDGNSTLSNIITLENSNDLNFTLDIFPNPATDIFNLNVFANTSSAATLKIYNEVGEMIVSKDVELNSGANNSVLDLSSFSHGIYTLRLSIGTQREVLVRKLVKL